MFYKRYRFHKYNGTKQGHELWIWIMWAVLILGIIVICSYSIGKLSAHNKYINLVNGMVKQYEFGCEKIPKGITVPIYDSTGRKIKK